MKSASRLVRATQLSMFALFAATLIVPQRAHSQDQAPSSTNPDNSAQNKAHATTADQQSEATQDRMLTKKIRQALIADKSLSMYAHNVKIIVQNGSVTLKGPVKSDEEKQSIASKAAEIAGGPDKITNQLTITQP
jgi:hyperosmotically inducible periplasmic protein